MLCENCERGLAACTRFPPFLQKSYGPHHGTLAEFLQALQLGCYCCLALFNKATSRVATGKTSEDESQLSEAFAERTGEAVNSVSIYLHSWWRGASSDEVRNVSPHLGPNGFCLHGRFDVVVRRGTVEAREFDRHRSDIRSWVSFQTSKSLGLVKTTLPPIPTQNKEVSLEPNWALIKCWISKCTTQHKLCSRNHSIRRPLPKRLVEILDDTIILREEITDLDCRYATLSHCWGSVQPLRLTRENVSRLKVGIEIESLPRTFLHALTTCQKLEIRYLWIDSLCIYQDDMADWQQQSSSMAEIYSASFINIGATSAEDSSRGCFFPHDPRHIGKASFKPGKSYLGKDWFLLKGDLIQGELETQPLLQRGWVMQERILANRMIHFTQSQLWWECSQMRACETFPDGLPRTRIFTSEQHNFFSIKQRPSDSYDAYQCWLIILENYSACLLSKPKDRLVAISGLARKFDAFFSNSAGYVAGLWEQKPFFQNMLLWEPYEVENKNAGGQEGYIAPSWSWASCPGPVRFGLSVSGPHSPRVKIPSQIFWMEIEEAHQSPATPENPFGAVENAYIQLKCLILPVKEEVQEFPMGLIFKPQPFLREIWVPELHEEGCLAIFNISPNTPQSWRRLMAQVALGLVFAMPVATSMTGRIEGLLIEKVEASKEEYRRVGTFIYRRYPYYFLRLNSSRPYRDMFHKRLTSEYWKSVVLV